MRTKIKEMYPILIPILAYILSLILIKPWGNYAINDDFYYFVQVKAFSQGLFTKSALIAPSFIAQGFIGLVWSKIFGLSFNSLRILTILISTLCIFGIYKILCLFKIKKEVTLITLLTIAFNPIFYYSSLSFMTENYFLAFIIWSLYFFLSFIEIGKLKHLVFSSLLLGLSVMVRQYGVVILPIYLVFLLLKVKPNVKNLLALLLPFSIFSLVGLFWPSYKNILVPSILSSTVISDNFRHMFEYIFDLSITPYIGFFLISLSLIIFLSGKRLSKIIISISSLFLAYVYYKWDIFRISNVFYLEGLFAKSTTALRQSIFNNISFKIFISYISSLSFLSLAYVFIRKLINLIKVKEKKSLIKNNLSLFILLVTTIVFYCLASASNPVQERYDRYYLNFFVFLAVLLGLFINSHQIKICKGSYSLIIVLCSVSVFVNLDYFREQKLKWNLASRLNGAGISSNNIYLNNNYTKYANIEFTHNYNGEKPAMPGDFNPDCFIQNFSKQESNFLNNFLNNLEKRRFVARYFKNPQIVGFGYAKSSTNSYSKKDIVYFDEEYKSPMYNLIGKRMFIRAFCKGI